MRENTGNHAGDIKTTIKHGETEITITKEAIHISAPEVVLDKGREGMSKVDELIETLAESIQESIKSETCFAADIAAQTKALAELVSARAKEY